MSEDRITRLEELWDGASALAPDERARFIASADVDPSLRDELTSLLGHADHAALFFEHLGVAAQDVLTAASLDTEEDESDDSLIGNTVGRYRIEERLGAGGMGVVYRAYDTSLQRTVALKFLTTRHDPRANARERILSEARAAAALDHTNICTIHEVGDDPHSPPFIAMAYYAGETLEHVLVHGQQPVPTAVDYALQIARGLAAAHDRGIIHRDVKPANVMITAGNVVKLLDFGIAHGTDTAHDAARATIAYMAPELIRGAAADERSDLWSLGVTLYELCTGVRPFAGDDHAATLHAILHSVPAAASSLRRGVPAELDRIIARLLAKDPAARYASAHDVATHLQVLAAQPTRRGTRPMRAIAAGLTGLVTIGALLVAARDPTPARILIADAEGDTIVGRLVTDRLGRSVAGPRVAAVGRPSLVAALTRMGRVADARLTPPVARELALREGLRAYVHVSVDRIGRAYSLSAVLIEPESGDIIDNHQSVALGEMELTEATERLAAGLRKSFDRSLRILPRKDPLLAVTTDSMSALRVHLQAVQTIRNGDFRRGIQLNDETIDIDSSFADAHQTRAFALEQIGLRAGRAQNSIMDAYALRPRLARHERYLVEADHLWHIEGDLASAIASLRNAHQAIEEVEPGRVLNRRSFGFALMLHGDYEEAEQVLQQVRYAPCPPTNSHLVNVLHVLGRDDEARIVLDRASNQWPTNPFLGMDRAHYLARDGNLRGAHDLAAQMERSYTTPFALRAQAVFDAAGGRVGEAIDHLEMLRAEHVAADMLAPAIEVATAIGRLHLVAGDTAAGIAQLERFLARYPADSLPAAERPYLTLALFFADAHATQRARELLHAYQTHVPERYRGPDRWMQLRTRAALLMSLDSAHAALAVLREAGAADRIWSHWLDNLLFAPDARPELARAYDRLGQADSAIAVYERYLDTRILYRSEMDAFHLAHTLHRLSVLHAQRGNRDRAAHYRSRLDAWLGDADGAMKRVWKAA